MLLPFDEVTERTNREHIAAPSGGFKGKAFRLGFAGIAAGRDALPRPRSIDTGEREPY